MAGNSGGPAPSAAARAARRGRDGRAVPLIAVIGGCGGAGASTLAASLAVAALGAGRRAILFDADPLGGGLEPLVALGTFAVAPDEPYTARVWRGGEEPAPTRPAARPGRPGRATTPDLALVTWGGALGDPVPVASMRNALRILRDNTELVVVDLPRVIDDATQLVLAEATHTLVVAPVSERSAVSTARLLPRLAALGPPPQLVARLPSRDELTAREFVELLDAPLAGIVRPDRGRLPGRGALRQLGGRSAASLARFSRRLVERCCAGTGAGSADVPARRAALA
jgi:hypothetical protein